MESLIESKYSGFGRTSDPESSSIYVTKFREYEH